LRTVQAGNSGLKIAALNGVEQFFQNEAARFRHFNNHEVHMGVELAVFPASFILLPETQAKGIILAGLLLMGDSVQRHATADAQRIRPAFADSGFGIRIGIPVSSLSSNYLEGNC